MANTFELIEATTLTGSQSSVTIGSGGTIPQTYTDLCLVVSSRNTSTGGAGYIRFNGSTTGYTVKYMEGAGSGTPTSGSDTTLYCIEMTTSASTANTFGNNTIYIPNYVGSSYKSVSSDGVMETNGTTAYAALYAGLWSNTAAITSITIYPVANSFAQYSSFYLYGVKNA